MLNHVFVSKAPRIMRGLMARYGLKDFQAGGILGNIGTECAGFLSMHETGQAPGRGGYGWCMWTASRREKFFAWCKLHKLDWRLDAANEGYLYAELDGEFAHVIQHLKNTHSLDEATEVFEREFEMAGVINMASRNNWAHVALNSFQASDYDMIA